MKGLQSYFKFKGKAIKFCKPRKLASKTAFSLFTDRLCHENKDPVYEWPMSSMRTVKNTSQRGIGGMDNLMLVANGSVSGGSDYHK